ncbi:hypothetical protein TNCV_2641431 [Trichonephila clavipes]|nr:hypothetical protein TNCV_2641431 [Trichonephila clavipes]
MALGTDESWTCKTGAVLKLSTNRLLGFSTRAEPALRLRAKLVANDDCSAFKMLKTTAGVTNFDFMSMLHLTFLEEFPWCWGKPFLT